MNQQTQTMTDFGLKSTRSTCPKCGYIRDTTATNCADCGKPLQKVSTIKTLGVVLVVLGSSLLALMGWALVLGLRRDFKSVRLRQSF